MAGVQFSHAHVGTLNLRLPPTSVEWTYNMNTSTTDTYAGQVVQILSINFDKVILTGRFGREGAHGRSLQDGKYLPRGVGELQDWQTSERFGVGLHQMHEWFQLYFSVASQGDDTDRYIQEPVKIIYQGRLDVGIDDGVEEIWSVYPTSFPSFRRSNQEFAPEWRVECEVFQAPANVVSDQTQADLERLRDAVGYTPSNRFSDPAGQFLPSDFGDKLAAHKLSGAKIAELRKSANQQLQAEINNKWDTYMSMLPAYTDADLENLIMMNGSLPALAQAKAAPGASVSNPSGSATRGTRSIAQ